MSEVTHFFKVRNVIKALIDLAEVFSFMLFGYGELLEVDAQLVQLLDALYFTSVYLINHIPFQLTPLPISSQVQLFGDFVFLDNVQRVPEVFLQELQLI